MEGVYDGKPYIYITGLNAAYDGYYKKEGTLYSDRPLYKKVQNEEIVMRYELTDKSWMIGTEKLFSQKICNFYVNAVDANYPEELIKGKYYWYVCGSQEYNNDVSVIGVTVKEFNLQSGISADTEIPEAQDADTEIAVETRADDVTGVLDSANIYVPDLSELSDILTEDYADPRELYMSDDEPGVLAATIIEAKKEDLKTMLKDLSENLNLFENLKLFSHKLFTILDKNTDGNISYSEYLSYLSTDIRGSKEIRNRFIELVKNSLNLSDSDMKSITDETGKEYPALKIEDAGKSLNSLMNVLNKGASIHSDSREINANDLDKYISSISIYSFDKQNIKKALSSLIICIDLAIAKLQIEVKLNQGNADEDLKANMLVLIQSNMLVLIQYKKLLQECDEVSEEELNKYVDEILKLFNQHKVLNINGNVTDIELNDKINILEQYMKLIKNFIESNCLIDNKINSKDDLIYILRGLKISSIQYDMMPKGLYPNLIQTSNVKRTIKYRPHRSRSSSPQRIESSPIESSPIESSPIESSPIERSRATTPLKTKGIDLKDLLSVKEFLSSNKLSRTDVAYIKNLFSDSDKIFWILTQPFELFQTKYDMSAKIIEYINTKIEALEPGVVQQLKNEFETEKTIIRYYLENDFKKKSEKQKEIVDKIDHNTIKYMLWVNMNQLNKSNLNPYQLALYNSLSLTYNKEISSLLDKTSSKRPRFATREEDGEKIEEEGQGKGEEEGQGKGEDEEDEENIGVDTDAIEAKANETKEEDMKDEEDIGVDTDAIEAKAKETKVEDMDVASGGKKINNDELFEKVYTMFINNKNKIIYKKPNDKKEYVRYNKEYITIKEYEKVIKKKSKKGEILTFKF